jgi:hypothetical protein
MKDLIVSIRRTTQLYRPPARIGDVLDGKWLIIGIQDIDITYSRLEITYVCQNLEQDFVYQTATSKGDELREFELRIKTGKEHILKRIALGKLVWYKNTMPFQTVEYTDVNIKFTDIVVSFLARPIRPVARKEAKAKLLSEKRKKLNLTIH